MTRHIASALSLMAVSMTLPVSALAETDQTPEAGVRLSEAVGVIGFVEARHDFGELVQSEAFSHTFYYLNNGTAPITIESAGSQTSGVSVLVSHEPLQPGEYGEIEVRLDTSAMTGLQMIRIGVLSDAYNAPSTLYLTGKVIDMENAGE